MERVIEDKPDQLQDLCEKYNVKCKVLIFTVSLFIMACGFTNRTFADFQKIILPTWEEPTGMTSEKILLGYGKTEREGWGGYSPNERAFLPQLLPALFQRTLEIDSISGDRGIKWIFTGPREAFNMELKNNKLVFYRRYYDSFGFNLEKEKLPSYPFKSFSRKEFVVVGEVKAITVGLNHKLSFAVSLNGQEVISEKWMEDIRRNQIHLTGDSGQFTGRMLEPEMQTGRVSVNPSMTYQKMLGWGGIGTATADNELSMEGKGKWWEYLKEYNLLCQREYPVGSLLHKNLDNWDSIQYSKAHYYGDNFPNGEISDFSYNKKIQELGGFVIFEFWDFPGWIGKDENEYARAMVGYCREAKEKTGHAAY